MGGPRTTDPVKFFWLEDRTALKLWTCKIPYVGTREIYRGNIGNRYTLIENFGITIEQTINFYSYYRA